MNVRQGWKALLLIAAATATLSMLGCPAQMNPVTRAKTIEQKTYASYGVATIFAERGAALIQDPSLSDSLKRPVALAITAAKPVADKGLDAISKVSDIRAEVEAGATREDDLLIAASNLDKYYLELEPLVGDLVAAVTKAIKCGKLSGEARVTCEAGGAP